jgi:type I restriction enzyme S subunit
MSNVTPDRRRLRWVISHTATGPSPTCENRNIADDEWGVLKTTAITWEGWDPMQHKVLPEQYWGNKAARVQVGDVVVTKAGPRHRVGVAAYVNKPSERLIVSGKMVLLRPDPKVADGRYLAWNLSTPGPQSFLESRKTGMAESQMNFANEDLLGMPLDLPNLEEQRRIADFLTSETARIDRLISLRQQQIALLNERSYSLISETLQPTKADDTAQSLVKVGHACRLHPGISPSALPKKDDTFVVRPYLQIGNVQSGMLRLENIPYVALPESLAATAKLRKGDVLTTRVGDPDKLGRAAVWNEEVADCLFESNIFALRPDTHLLVPEYLALMTRTAYGRHYFESTGSKTTGLASTNTGKILGFRIPLPDVKTQHQYVEKVHNSLIAIERIRNVLTRQSAVLRERRQALITAAVTGQFDVSTASGRNVTEGISA